MSVKIPFSTKFCRAGASVAASPGFMGRREEAGKALRSFYGFLGLPGGSPTFLHLSLPSPRGSCGFALHLAGLPAGKLVCLLFVLTMVCPGRG